MQADANWVGSQITGNFTLYNGTITGLSTYTVPANYLGDTSTSITITLTADATGDAVLAWGGHIADRADWGEDNSAIAIPGSPYHMRLEKFTCSNDNQCNVGQQDRSLSAGAVVYPADVTIIKQASPEGSTLFSFIGNLGNFNLTDDGSVSNTIAFDEIVTFTAQDVTETIPVGWSLDSISCQESASGQGTTTTTTDLATATATLGVDEGESITCTFTKSLKWNLRVNKVTTLLKQKYLVLASRLNYNR
jgi:hypothetical protein